MTLKFGVMGMYVVVVSVNYRTAPVEIREKLTFNQTELAEAMKALQKQKVC